MTPEEKQRISDFVTDLFADGKSPLDAFGIKFEKLEIPFVRWPPARNVICYRCLNVYDQTTAPFVRTKGLKKKERACPRCECKVYFS